MPSAPTWAAQVPEILSELDKMDPHAILTCQQVASLLSVKERAAQEVISTAGAVEIGRAKGVLCEDLSRYLTQKLDPAIVRQEARRRGKFGRAFVQMEKEHKVGVRRSAKISEAESGQACQMGLRGLPDGVEVGPGRIVIDDIWTNEAAIKKLHLLAKAALADPLALQQALNPDGFAVADERPVRRESSAPWPVPFTMELH